MTDVRIRPSTALTPPTSEHPHKTAYRRVTYRLIPLLVLCYVVSNLDRLNISFAKLQMMKDLHLSDTVYGLGAGLFFIGYAAVEVPSNLLLHKFGARIWISRILLTWGLISAAFSIVSSTWMFYVLRFALGVAEAGLFPGIIYYLTQWYPRYRRATITSLLYVAVPIAGSLGSVLSGLIIDKMDNVSHLAGWQWMFIVEAVPAILLAPVVFFFLPDRPELARWLSSDEKRLLVQELANEEEITHSASALSVLGSLRVWHLGAILFTFVLALYGAFFFLPTMIHSAGISRPLDVGLVTAIPYTASIVMMIGLSRHSDRLGERRWHLIGSSLVGALGMVASLLWKNNIYVVVVGMSLTVGGVMTTLPVFWGMATGVFRGASEAVAIAFINSLGLIAGFVAPSMIGVISDWSGSLNGGMYLIALFWVLGSILVFMYRDRASRSTIAA